MVRREAVGVWTGKKPEAMWSSRRMSESLGSRELLWRELLMSIVFAREEIGT
jgi:hypothetical protein